MRKPYYNAVRDIQISNNGVPTGALQMDALLHEQRY
jgi:hypothetical protein